MNVLFITKVKILVLIEWSYMPPPPIVLTIEPRMLSIFWARSPISFKHMSFWCPFFLDILLRSTYHSNTGIHIIAMLRLGTSTITWKGAPMCGLKNTVISVPVPADNILQCVIIFGGVFMHLSICRICAFYFLWWSYVDLSILRPSHGTGLIGNDSM